MDTEALRSIVACYRDPRDAQKRVDNPHQLTADLDAFDAAANTIDTLRSEVERLNQEHHSMETRLAFSEQRENRLIRAISAAHKEVGDA